MSDISTRSRERALHLVQVSSDDEVAVSALTDFTNVANAIDDPRAPEALPSIIAGELAYGWDLHPEEAYFAYARAGDPPVGVLRLDFPHRDNRHLVWAAITVHPDHRRRGHGTALLGEVERRAAAAARSTIWLGLAADDPGARAFVESFGFRYANPEARRRQQLDEVDPAVIDRLFAEASPRAAEYELVRIRPPYSEELLAALVEVTEAINDAPMGELTFEDEVFDLDRLRAIEQARIGRGDQIYRVIARHRATGAIGGHTVVVIHPDRPRFGHQGDTAVSKAHRGHRLGLLLKIDMMRWLAEAEPQLGVIETSNQAGNDFMISVNEQLGYRLDRIFHLYEKVLD